MPEYNANVGRTPDQRYAPPGTATCASCGSAVLPGSRWCPLCHASVLPGLPGVLASPAKRLGAHVIDMFLPFCLLLAFGGFAALSHRGSVFGALMLAYVVWAIVLFARGTTPGKNMLGMDVVDEQGQPATFWRMLLREWIGKFISGVVCGLGYLWILIDKDRQGWHDKLASTYVVVRPFRD